MKNSDTNDPLPEDENLGSAGSPHSTGRNLHQRSANFESTEQGISPAHCEICGTSIPPTHDRCPDHQRNGEDKSSSDSHSWTISNIGLVIVAASSKFHALANASVALRRRDGGHGSDDSFDLIYDFGEPSETLTSGWGGKLPNAVELDSSLGEELFERAVSKTKSGHEEKDEIGGVEVDLSNLRQSSDIDSYLFNERGEAISEKEQLDAFNGEPENNNHDYWVIPALLYNRSRDTNEEVLRAHECVNCAVTQHVFDGLVNDPEGTDRDQIGIWVCLECESEKAGSPPENYDEKEIASRTTPTVGDEKPINKAEEEQFEAVMERLEAEDELDDASESS